MQHVSAFPSALLFLTLAVAPAAAADLTVEGTLVDAKCYLSDNSATGNDHGAMKECGTMCLKGGSPAAVLAKDRTLTFLVAPAIPLAPYVGQHVRATGERHGGALLVKKLAVRQGGRWVEVKLGPAM
jgi:hypothetical protein